MAHPSGSNSSQYGFSDDADIILRSSDNVGFYVIGAFLRYVSLLFKDMFTSIRNDNTEKKDNLPVVPVAEDSEIHRLLLDTIYPSNKTPQLSSPVVTWKVSKAAQKYMMKMIERKLKKHIAKSRLVVKKPLNMYAISIDLGWENVAINAARWTLDTPLQDLAYGDELYLITGADFYRFLEYRHLCENSKNPQKEVLPPLRSHKDSVETHTSSSGSDTSHSNHINMPCATASEPYTRSELSDLVLRTLDGVNFYVVAAFLRFSSPFFNRKFPLENPATKGGLAVIDVEEESNVLRLLLSFIYPMQEPEIKSTGLYARLVFAARKYEMMDIENKVRRHAGASSLVAAEPLQAYAVASTLGWTSLAKTAALNTLDLSVQELTYVDEMHLMTGAQLFYLILFHLACANIASDTDTLKIEYLGLLLQNLLEKTAPDVLSERLKVCPRLGSTVTNA